MAAGCAQEGRSRIMSRIRSKETGPEILLRKALWSIGCRGYRLHSSSLPGKPDIVLGPARVAVFVDGCFWHRCPLCYSEPTSNVGYWRKKINRNVQRAQEVNRTLSDMGWKVVRIWEHDINKDPDASARLVAGIVRDQRAVHRWLANLAR